MPTSEKCNMLLRMDAAHVAYRFELEGREDRFDGAKTPSQVEPECPDWAKLGFNQCECCPLKEKTCNYCRRQLIRTFFGEVSGLSDQYS